jgi:hypothetical protein
MDAVFSNPDPGRPIRVSRGYEMRMHSRKSRKAPRVVVLLLLCAAGLGLWWALTVGPEPTIALETDRPAVGRATRVVADFAEPQRGLGVVRLEVRAGIRAADRG